MRPSKVENWLSMAREVSKRSPCSRRKFGAILVRDDVILATGYNGTCRGAINCGLDIACLKDLYHEPHEESYAHCPAIHSEENAIICASRNGVSAVGSTLYLATSESDGGVDRPCPRCRRMLVNAGVRDVVYVGKDGKVITDHVAKEYVKMEDDWIRGQLKVSKD